MGGGSKMPRARKSPAEVSATRRRVALEAWANLTEKQRAKRQKRVWKKRLNSLAST